MGVALYTKPDVLQDVLLDPINLTYSLTSYTCIIMLLVFLITCLPDHLRTAVFPSHLRRYLLHKATLWLLRVPGTDHEVQYLAELETFIKILQGRDWNVNILEKDLSGKSIILRNRPIKCRARSCNKAALGNQIHQCSRCKSVVYCSKRHQKADWEDENCPHKAMCYRTSW